MKYECPQDFVGDLVIPEGCTYARVDNCAAVTSITFPEGCTYARVYNCANAKITRLGAMGE